MFKKISDRLYDFCDKHVDFLDKLFEEYLMYVVFFLLFLICSYSLYLGCKIILTCGIM